MTPVMTTIDNLENKLSALTQNLDSMSLEMTTMQQTLSMSALGTVVSNHKTTTPDLQGANSGFKVSGTYETPSCVPRGSIFTGAPDEDKRRKERKHGMKCLLPPAPGKKTKKKEEKKERHHHN